MASCTFSIRDVLVQLTNGTRTTVRYQPCSRNRGGNSASAFANRSVSDCETAGTVSLMLLIVADVVK